jgi:ethanolamine ammonia-lyase large subunit
MNLSTSIRGERLSFTTLREVFAKANEEKSGNQLAGLAARTERGSVAIMIVLAHLIDHCGAIRPKADLHPFVPAL